MNILGTKAEYSLLLRSFYLSVSSKTHYPPRMPRKLPTLGHLIWPSVWGTPGWGRSAPQTSTVAQVLLPAALWRSGTAQDKSSKANNGQYRYGVAPNQQGRSQSAFPTSFIGQIFYQLRTDLNLTIYGAQPLRHFFSSSLTWTKQRYFTKLQVSGDKHVRWGHNLQLVHVKGICPLQVWPNSLQVRISCSSPHWHFGGIFSFWG